MGKDKILFFANLPSRQAGAQRTQRREGRTIKIKNRKGKIDNRK